MYICMLVYVRNTYICAQMISKEQCNVFQEKNQSEEMGAENSY